MVQVAFQGENGAYSEQAALALYGKDVETKPCRTLRQVFESVNGHETELGVVPAENSIEGSINQTYDLLLDFALRISAEFKLRIEHCLLALPGTSAKDVKVIYSHPQALAQCSAYLSNVQAETVPAYDTAGSAKMISERKLRETGAIASERAATLYGLEVLKRNIEDFSDNFTRFFVIGGSDAARTGRDKTTIAFGTKHSPGSLHLALGEFASRKMNLTRIESRPLRTTPWEYCFFVDFEAHRTDAACVEALKALEGSTTFLRVLGSYPRTS